MFGGLLPFCPQVMSNMKHKQIVFPSGGTDHGYLVLFVSPPSLFWLVWRLFFFF